jgi:nucleoside-diphosphate-sugar epimerase
MPIDGKGSGVDGERVLVTGGTGFLGAYIIKELVDRNYQVRAIRRTNKLPFFIPASVLARVEWVDGDILDSYSLEEAMQDVQAVVHAAAKVSFAPGDRDSLFRTNITGTANVVNAALEKNIDRLLYVSSVAALGRSMNGATINEGSQWEKINLNTNYARSKYQAEMEVWRGIAEGLPAVVVNPSTILGYGDWNTSSCAIFKNVYNQFPWYTNGVNGFVDVEDAAKAVCDLLKTSICGERFVLSGENWSFRQLFNAIADGFSKKHPTREATALLAGIAWRMEHIKTFLTGTPSLLTRESSRLARNITYFDSSKIRQFLPGFRFTPLEQTISQSCHAYLKQEGRPA